MGRFFTRERFGRPQITALLLLLAFLAQCGWLVSPHLAKMPAEVFTRIEIGAQQWLGKGIASRQLGHEDHSPVWYLIAAAPYVAASRITNLEPYRYGTLLGSLPALPFLIFGALLGGSLWYVARRLYGNAGGYIALALYCFSPAIIQASAMWFSEPATGEAWGAFGAVFTAIAVAHTLYAPREVVLWNWRRIVLLALSFALAVGSQFSLVVVVPVALAFMFYLAPTRRLAAFAIWASACGLALILLFASYFFHPGAFWQGLSQARYFPILWQAFAMPGAYQRVFWRVAEGSPALLVAVPLAVITYAAWPRTRYFGNTAPLLMSFLFLLLSVGSPHAAGASFQLMAFPFLFVFVSGIASDLLESRYRRQAFAGLAGLVFANAIWNVWALIQAR